MLILEWHAIVRSLTWKQFIYSTEEIIFHEGSSQVVLNKSFRKEMTKNYQEKKAKQDSD